MQEQRQWARKASKAMSGQERLSTQGREDRPRRGSQVPRFMLHLHMCHQYHGPLDTVLQCGNAALASLGLRAREGEDEHLEGFMASRCLILDSQM